MNDLPEAKKVEVREEDEEKIYGRKEEENVDEVEQESEEQVETEGENDDEKEDEKENEKEVKKEDLLEEILIKKRKEEMIQRQEQERLEARKKKLESLTDEEKIDFLANESKYEAEILALKTENFLNKERQTYNDIKASMPDDEWEVIAPVVADLINDTKHDEAFKMGIEADRVAASIVAEAKGIKQEEIYAIRQKKQEDKMKTEEKIEKLKDFSTGGKKIPSKESSEKAQQDKAKRILSDPNSSVSDQQWAEDILLADEYDRNLAKQHGA